MKKLFTKMAAALLFCLLPAAVFSQTAKNTITVDTGPMISGLSLGSALNTISSGSSLKGTGFGIGLQYERLLLEKLSVAGRLAYMGIGLKSPGESLMFWSISAEGHVRFYPAANVFFLDGMLGYANFTMSYSGGEKLHPTAHYFKTGLKLGWRIDFGKPGGFIFEPAFGYYLGFTGQKKAFDAVLDDFDSGSLESAQTILANVIFVGGPRVSLNFGWAF